jgi:DNA-directed RNA polymerase sigma subunit (sigma70/sigma32)
MKSLSFFERREIIDTFCNSGRPFSSVLNPRQEKIIRWYFGLNKSRKKLTLVAIAHKFQISPVAVYSILFVSLFKLKYPHLPVGKSFQSKTFQKGKIILADFFKRGLFLSASLNKKQETFIRLRYGLDGRKPLTLQAIGKRYGITRESVRKTNLRSLQKLK